MRRTLIATLALLALPLVASALPIDPTEQAGFFAAEPQFPGGVSVALCGPWTVVGLGAGGPPLISVFFTAHPHLVFRFLAYDAGFRGGVTVGCTIDDDGQLRVVTGAGPGGGPHVRVFRLPVPP